jgi:hypothetical protein
MKKKNNIPDEDMRKEYDFSGGIRGKYYKKYHQGTNIVALDPDVARIYKNSKTVNDILRAISKIAFIKT